MKKRIIAFVITIVMALNLTACNWTFFDTEYTFNAAITIFNGKTYFYHIVKWTDYEGEQIQIVLEDGSVIIVSSFNTILVHWNDNGTSTIYNDIKAAEEQLEERIDRSAESGRGLTEHEQEVYDSILKENAKKTGVKMF